MAQSNIAAKEAWCVKCNRLLPVDNFYKSPNKHHTNGYLPYCKECAKKIFKDYLQELGNLQGALWATCAEQGVPYIQEIVDRVQEAVAEKQQKVNTKSQANYFGNYLRYLGMLRMEAERWTRFIDTNVAMNEMVSLEDRKAKIEEEIAKFKLDWGEFDGADDYAFLEYRYDTYTDGIELKPAQETLYRKLCIAELRARKVEAKGESTKDIQKQILDLMNKLKIDNFAEIKDKDLTEQLLETQIAMHEKTQPMEFYDQKELYDDACGLGNGWNRILRPLLNFCLGHKDYPKVRDGGVDG